MPTILDDIVAAKREEVARAKVAAPEAVLRERLAAASPVRDFLAALGAVAPIVPGIIPILSAGQIKRFVALSGADLPKQLVADLEKHGDDDEAATQFGIEYATRQCEELLREGAPGIHFYTLNKARSTTQILKNLGLR